MFGSKHKAKINEYAILMANVITHSSDFDDDALRYMSEDEFAYLQGHRCIEDLRLGTRNSRRLANGFRDALVGTGLPTNDAIRHVDRFWLF